MTQNNWSEIMSGLFSSVCMIFTWFFGYFDGALRVLIAFVIVDYILGVTAAAIEGRLSSAEGFKGIRKKMIIFALIGVAHVVGKEVFGNELMLRDMVTYFYIANEGMSIIENAAAANVPIPDGLKKFFEKLHGDNDKSPSPEPPAL